MNELCEVTKWNSMLLLYLGSMIIIQTYSKPVNEHEYHTKRNITTENNGFRRQFEVQCSDTRCCWVHSHGHDTHDHHCGFNLHPARTHSYQCRGNNGYDVNACGLNMRKCGRCHCKAHSLHGYDDCGRCYCGHHALHNTASPCNSDFDSHSYHDYIGAGAINRLDCNSDDDDQSCRHISHAGYAHHRQPIIHHVPHFTISVPHHSTCRVWKENDCVKFLREYAVSNLEPVHLYGTTNKDGISHTSVPSQAVTLNKTLEAAPIPATVPSNPSPSISPSPIMSSHAAVYPLSARVEPTDVEIEPLDTDINPNFVANTNNQPIATGNKLITHRNISTVQSLEAPSTVTDTANDPSREPGITANVPLQAKVDNTEVTNGVTIPSRADARLTLDSPEVAGGDALREAQNIDREAKSNKIAPSQSTVAPAHPGSVIKLAHGTVIDDLQKNTSVDNAEDNAVAGENIVPAQAVRKPVYAKAGSTGQGNVISTDADIADVNVAHRPVLTKAVPSVHAGNAVTNTDVRRPIVQPEPLISDVEGSLDDDAGTNEEDVVHAHDDHKFVYSNDGTPTTGDELVLSSETKPVKATKTGNYSIKSPVVEDNESNEKNLYTVEDVASDDPNDTDVTPEDSKVEETTKVTNLSDRRPLTADQLTTSANLVTNIADQKILPASHDTAIASHLDNRAPQVTKRRDRPAETATKHNIHKLVLLRKLPKHESAN